MTVQYIVQIDLLDGYILIVEELLDYMKMEKKNVKDAEQKIYFAIEIILVPMIIKIKNLIVIKSELFYNI